MEVISQNLANADTAGYKKNSVLFKDYLFGESNNAPLSQKVMSDLALYSTDFSGGNLVETGNPLDIAMEGSGFIALEGNRYTRRGDLKLDDKGHLVTSGGQKVMGDKGPIVLPKGRIEIATDGKITVDGIDVDTIKVVDFERLSALSRVGDSTFTAAGGEASAKGRVLQGYLERSNVEVVREMVQMIEALREFETYQKAVQAFDEAASRVNNDMGRV